jgi:hypothetical protein
MKNFALVITLASSAGFKDSSDAEDLRTLAAGFIDLARASDSPRAETAAAAAPAPQASAPAPITTPAAAAAAPASTTPVTSPVNPTPKAAAPALSAAAAPAPAVPSPSPAATPGPRPVEAAPALVPAPGLSEVTQPIALKQTIPPVPSGIVGLGGPTSAVRITIGIDGKVSKASLQQASHPLYDRLVLQAAREWLYTPAMLNGKPVPSEKVVTIQLR